ncbi:sensor histidine kinase [Companilactobacillus nuruki]|uniref:histidine kinase n=1 Tax=Companilactobacillus nuruki TaxID=1993540 RepID=A0A2N7AU44_9LACO|nr:sensor histidine kinase [Companilactobacillus nuruki]PMD70311.1 two-component sensor histidine kinase [Companilactobacillus nuruki]
MKTFVQKHILFPKRLGFMPYFWVFSLFLMAGQLLAQEPHFNWLHLILIIIFLKFYHDGYWINQYLWLDIFVQLAIAIYFTVTFPDGGGTFFIYTAWEIGSLPLKSKKFFQYYFIFLIASLGCIATFVIFNPLMDKYGIFGMIITLTFTIGSPLAARSVANSYRRSFQTRQNNKRLESIIKQNERDRIAKDLHDNIGQSFSIITLKAELASKLIDKDPQKAQQQLQDISKTSREDLNLVRKIVADLNEKTIASAMIEEENNLQLAGIHQNSINEEISTNWPKSIQHVLAAVIKEASTNVIRYSKANTMKLTFEEDQDNYLLEIKDDGIGFQKSDNHQTFGLVGMRTRLNAINGKIEIESNHGVSLKISVPKKE